MRRAVIISGGDVISFSILKDQLKVDDYIIAVDRGIDYVYDNGIRADIVLGDFDSVSDYERVNELEKKGAFKLAYPEDKDYTDTELALSFAQEKGFDKVLLLGATGTRLDHTLANVFLLVPFALADMQIDILMDNGVGYVREASTVPIELREESGRIFSVLPLTSVVEGLNITGARYPLSEHRLVQGNTLTVSNEVLDVARISFNKGVAMVIQVSLDI